MRNVFIGIKARRPLGHLDNVFFCNNCLNSRALTGQFLSSIREDTDKILTCANIILVNLLHKLKFKIKF